ncbi:hypothetical protein EXU11_18720 [Klebsiella quasipneumoniae subsp. quasipneumoniae]|nr:hypothetical protein EXU05_15810 [Klebsiella quasipneumoniae subsp. quasipneumoniae]TBP75842.1 hypothetical protein EXT99_04785 [Klebsiella quasipneumoniae subsp. quasipneumoniae]TBQ07987.1 hypothetical protein EXU07_02295 [Klebsiella quasipneumoniae subsp. quasipneumoniae]TBQ65483.1 hypothetical protein EXU11_18720 [Klebsiella quasipneumoniae subsp. quasipneumoniae]
MGDAGPNAVYRLVQREMGMAISRFKGKIKKNFYLCAGAQKAAQPVIRKSDCDTLFLFTGAGWNHEWFKTGVRAGTGSRVAFHLTAGHRRFRRSGAGGAGRWR